MGYAKKIARSKSATSDGLFFSFVHTQRDHAVHSFVPGEELPGYATTVLHREDDASTLKELPNIHGLSQPSKLAVAAAYIRQVHAMVEQVEIGFLMGNLHLETVTAYSAKVFPHIATGAQQAGNILRKRQQCSYPFRRR
jgi:hypothetical protein